MIRTWPRCRRNTGPPHDEARRCRHCAVPYVGGTGSKVRPALVVQNDKDNTRLPNTIVLQITGNIQRAHEPTQVLIDVKTPEGQQTGLRDGP